MTGLLYGNTKQFIAQLIGAIVLCTVIFGLAYAFFFLQNKFTKGGIRSLEADEIIGLDIPEMGVEAYPEFAYRSHAAVATHVDDREPALV